MGKVHIVKDHDFVKFIGEALPLAIDPLKTLEERCPHCGELIRYPMMVRERDIEAFSRIIDLAERYIQGKGVVDEMLNDIFEQLRKALIVH